MEFLIITLCVGLSARGLDTVATMLGFKGLGLRVSVEARRITKLMVPDSLYVSGMEYLKQTSSFWSQLPGPSFYPPLHS